MEIKIAKGSEDLIAIFIKYLSSLNWQPVIGNNIEGNSHLTNYLKRTEEWGDGVLKSCSN